MNQAPRLTVVIPTLDEAAYLPALLEDLEGLPTPFEIVVCDGGSADETTQMAAAAGARVVDAPRGRARQLRRGADQARAAWLLFLHADCRVPAETLAHIAIFVEADDRNQHAHFDFHISESGKFWRFLEFGVRLRERLTGLVYGDQGLLVSTSAYHAAGGFPEWPIMEDVGMLDRLRVRGQERRLPAIVSTSPRRYREEGRVATWLRHAALIVLFRSGVSPSRLAGWRGASAFSDTQTLIVFAKAPRPGRVKTRLAADVGAREAARIYRTMGRRIVDALREGPYHLRVYHDPPEAEDELRGWLGSDGITLHAQAPGDLGDRMAGALDEALRDADRACIVGTDTPTLGPQDVADAFEALRSADVVLGPAEDGGYYLLGLNAPCPTLFHGIPWSTSGVLDATQERARNAGLTVHLLATKADVDTLPDVPADLLKA